MGYYVDVFTVETWAEAGERGFRVTGFPPPTPTRGGYFQATFDAIKTGDLLLCYVKAPAKRWVGALRVDSPMELDYDDPIWGVDEAGRARFPARFPVTPLITLAVERGLPVDATIGVLAALPERAWSGVFRRSLQKLPDGDGERLMTMLKEPREPVPVRIPRPRRRLPKPKASGGEALALPVREGEKASTPHTELVWKLIQLGRTLGCEVWVAPDERGRAFNGNVFTEHVLSTFPKVGLDPESRDVVQSIDVLWLRGKSIVAAFEVEATTSIYSGLLRMSDLVALQPNTNINLFIVAPDERRSKVVAQIIRPTFDGFEPPLRDQCLYLAASRLDECIERTRPPVNKHVQPTIVKEYAEKATATPV